MLEARFLSTVTFALISFVIAIAWAFAELTGTALAFGVLLAVQLSLLLAIDIARMLLPNVLTASLAATGLLASWWLADGMWWERILAMLVGFAILALLAWAYRRYRHREGLGLGDAKLLGALGAWVGLTGLPSILLLAAVGGLIFGLGRAAIHGRASLYRRLPFGPFLAIAGWVTWLYGPLAFGSV